MKTKTTQYDNYHQFREASMKAQREGVFISASSLTYEVTVEVKEKWDEEVQAIIWR